MNTYADMFASWEENIKPLIIELHGENDNPALAESWNDYTDMECKEGNITELQYHYCPAFDDPMPDNDIYFILDAMGVTLKSVQDHNYFDRTGQWSEGSTHWRVLLKYGEKTYQTEYHMGAAIKGSPELDSVLYSLLSDSDIPNQYDTMEDFACDFGYDMNSSEERQHAARIWKAVNQTKKAIDDMFGDKLEDLRELFADY